MLTLSTDNQEKFNRYLEYIDVIICEEMTKAVSNSIKYIKNEIENRNDNDAAVFEIKMLLIDSSIVFVPGLDINNSDSFLNFVEELCEDIFRQAAMMTKVFKPNETFIGSYVFYWPKYMLKFVC